MTAKLLTKHVTVGLLLLFFLFLAGLLVVRKGVNCERTRVSCARAAVIRVQRKLGGVG